MSPSREVLDGTQSDFCRISKTTFSEPRESDDPALTAEDERLDKTTKEWYRHLFPRQLLVVMIEKMIDGAVFPKESKEYVGGFWNHSVELLSYRYLVKCRLHGFWLHCGGGEEPLPSKGISKWTTSTLSESKSEILDLQMI